jgi:hypothetical protein
MSMRLLWAGTTPVHSAGARAGSTVKDRRSGTYTGCGWRTYRNETEVPNGVLGGSGWLDGLVVHGDISSDNSQTVHKETFPSRDAPNNRRGAARGLPARGRWTVFTAPLPVTYGRRSCSSSFRKVAPLEDAAQQASTLTNLVHA